MSYKEFCKEKGEEVKPRITIIEPGIMRVSASEIMRSTKAQYQLLALKKLNISKELDK